METLMRIPRLACALVALALLVGTGCAQVSKMTVASTKNVDMSAGAEKTGERKSASNSRLWILFIPFGRAPNFDRAMDRAIARGKGDFLTNVQVKQGGWSIIGLVSYGWVHAEGDVWRSKTPGAAPAPRPEAPDLPEDEPTEGESAE
jgi:hypothetical protein